MTMGSDWEIEFIPEEDENENTCPRCGMLVPPSHLETDSGVCITCEDEADGED